MFKPSVTLRLALGMALLTVTVQLLAYTLDIGPNVVRESLRHRNSLCETIAISSSILANRGDFRGLEANLQNVVERNSELLSAALRRDDGHLLAEVGDHEAHWIPAAVGTPKDTQVYVPVQDGDKSWGVVELRFAKFDDWSLTTWLNSPVTRQTTFVAVCCGIVFYFFLRKILRHLNPSRVIPARVRAALDTMVSGLVILDEQERIVLANRAFATAIGRPSDELQGLQAGELPWATKPPGNHPEFPWSQALRTGEVLTGITLELNRGEDQSRSYMVNSAPIAGDDGKCRGVLASFEDVTQYERTKAELHRMLDDLRSSRDEVRRKNDELKLLATRDPLTGCLNRRAFFETFEMLWDTAKRYNSSLCCVMVDVDHFKLINDKHGHGTGDVVLQKVGLALHIVARQCDVVCRYGGEEFCILLPKIDLDDGYAAADRYRLAIESLQIPDLSVTVSLGVSNISLGAADPQALIDQADKCLYVAKRKGRNQVVRWDELPHDVVVDERATADEKCRTPILATGGAAQSPGDAAGSPGSQLSHEDAEFGSIPFGVVSTLLAALAYRDSMTAEHSRRVADLCVLVGNRVLSVRDTYVLEMAALLHDIGKIGVPDAILLKPGPLSEDEKKIMGMHDHIGFEIIDSTFASPALIEIIRNRHALFGTPSPYPHLPRGFDIPLGARLLSICDAFDAITADRVYRPGRTRQEAFQELLRCAGSQFDPELVNLFIETIGAYDPSRNELLPRVSKQAAVQIGSQIEKLAEALDHRDCVSLAALAGRLQLVAEKQGIDNIAQAANRLVTSATDADLAEAYGLTIELLDLCRSIQDVHLEVDTPRGQA